MLRLRGARVFRTLSLYFGAVWIYVALIAVFKSQTLPQPLIHQLPALRRDTGGAICFTASFLFYALAQYLEPRRS